MNTPTTVKSVVAELTGPIRRLESVITMVEGKIRHLDGIRIDSEVTELHVKTERKAAVLELALGSVFLLKLKAIVGTAVLLAE